MTIREAIDRVDALMHNTYEDGAKKIWLSRADANIKMTIIDTHENPQAITFEEYNADTDGDTVLLAPAPFDELYLRWLEAQIHYHNGENSSYNAAIIKFNDAFNAFANWYNRTYMPLQKGTF